MIHSETSGAKIFCSTGTFTGRINNRSHRLVLDYGHLLHCDGFEIMMFNGWEENLDAIAREYRGAGLCCPVLHADKKIGDLMSAADTDKGAALVDLWKRNCQFAADIGAAKIVAHFWGPPESDANAELIYDRAGALLEIAAGFGLDLVAENVICVHKSPLAHIEELCRRYPALGVTVDTRQSQFWRETEKTCESALWKDTRVRHIHISDFHGAYKDWNALYPIREPGSGDVDFPFFFRFLRRIRYSQTISLEAPSIQREYGVEVEALNKSLDFIRNGYGPNLGTSAVIA